MLHVLLHMCCVCVLMHVLPSCCVCCTSSCICCTSCSRCFASCCTCCTSCCMCYRPAGCSSSRTSQDRLLSPFPARIWPEAFHASFVHNIQRKGEGKIGWRRSIGTTISTTTTTYHHTIPQLLQIKRWGEERRRKNLRKLSHTPIHAHSDLNQ